MIFKDDLREDIGVFVELEEFAQLTDIDNVLLPAQIQPHTAEKSARLTEQFEGLHGDFVEIFFPSAPYCKKKERLPRQGEWCYVNGIRYDVESVADELGICHMLLSAYRQNTLRYE